MRFLFAPVLAALVGLLLWGAPAAAEPTLTVTPETGPVGSRFVSTAKGLEPRAPYTLEMDLPDGTTDGFDFVAGDDGEFSVIWQVEAGGPAGTYTERLLSANGTVLATATLAVTGAGP